MRDLTEPIRDSYDRIAGEYAQRLFNELEGKPLDRELLGRFAAAVEGHGEVCDMGCGPGHIARFLRELGVSVFGLDLSPRMVEEARRLNPGIEFRAGDMLALDLPDGSLAGIAAFYSIVNFPEPLLAPVFRELARVLQPGGLLLLAFHTGEEIIREPEMWGVRVSMNFYFFKAAAIRKLLEESGFEVEEIVERGPYAPEVEHQSHRAYIFARRSTVTSHGPRSSSSGARTRRHRRGSARIRKP